MTTHQMEQDSTKPWHVFMYVQHLSGIGHQHRSARIARALTARGIHVSYVSGGMPMPELDIGSSKRFQLAPARARDQRYGELVDAEGHSVTTQWKDDRCKHLLMLLEESKANMVIVETYPFGRKLMRFELEPLVDKVVNSNPKTLLICSVRDILEPRADIQRYAPMANQVERYFDHVMIHSDPQLFDFADTFPLFDQIRKKVVYTGYISEAGIESGSDLSSPMNGEYHDAVVVSAGGGGTGVELLNIALGARELSQQRDCLWLLLAGPQFPQLEFEKLQAKATSGIVVLRNQSNFRELLKACRVSVSQAGYNTMLDLLSTGARAVLAPFALYNEREQVVRARHLSELGLARVVFAEDLSPSTLAKAIDCAASGKKTGPVNLDVNGARYSALLIEALLTGSRIPSRGVF